MIYLSFIIQTKEGKYKIFREIKGVPTDGLSEPNTAEIMN